MRDFLMKFMPAKKKTVSKQVASVEPKVQIKVETKTIEQKPFVKGPHHVVINNEVVLDPNYVNPGVFSSNA